MTRIKIRPERTIREILEQNIDNKVRLQLLSGKSITVTITAVGQDLIQVDPYGAEYISIHAIARITLPHMK